jgi:hypothetical protein
MINAISMYPTLFYLLKPRLDRSIENKTLLSPYTTHIHTAISFIYTLKKIVNLSKENTNDNIKFILPSSVLVVKICRTVIECIDVTIDGAINWRDTSRDRDTNRDTSTNNNSDNDNNRYDYGSITYLQVSSINLSIYLSI